MTPLTPAIDCARPLRPLVAALSVAAIVAGCHSKAPQAPSPGKALAEESVEQSVQEPVPALAAAAPAPAVGENARAPMPAVAAPSVPAVSEDADEIQKRFLATVTAGIAKADVGLRTPRTTFTDNVQDTVYAEYAGTYTYDIRKSESIVSPMVGTVSWDIRWFHNGVQEQEPMALEARYAYQSGKWVIQKLARKVNNQKFVSADEYLPLFQ